MQPTTPTSGHLSTRKGYLSSLGRLRKRRLLSALSSIMTPPGSRDGLGWNVWPPRRAFQPAWNNMVAPLPPGHLHGALYALGFVETPFPRVLVLVLEPCGVLTALLAASPRALHLQSLVTSPARMA
ncbi:hypothetical protein XA68_10206 [Ophiocordyceps unilateralis]|uniref:Uncharacterized protein n=1 Tax=Ophiocordyceps unilateralis TaxID=268505 RepID=A0A2A9P275_OPHUN|nr:hypothetical protein XA68_10206 [Ophiocordyceps unilateralis]